MSTKPPPAPPRTKSGEHAIVIGFRRKLDSLAEDSEEMDRLNEKLEQLAIATTSRPPVPDEVPTKVEIPKPGETPHE